MGERETRGRGAGNRHAALDRPGRPTGDDDRGHGAPPEPGRGARRHGARRGEVGGASREEADETSVQLRHPYLVS